MEGKSTGAVTTRQEVVKAIAEQIQIALTENNDSVPTDLEKVYLQYYSQQHAYGVMWQSVRVWFQNEAQKIVQGENIGSAAPKRDKRGHPASVKSWTPKSVCGSIYPDRVSDVQRRLSGGGETKDIGQYARALGEIFGELSEDELEQCTTLAEEWNAAEPSEDVQRK